ncbi:sensor protein [Nonlabens sp. YIK11]|uniref:tetratricopeptide repeat-containing hybrid sensor histidine kinase/response regulator n=1 Tax=Nonlabens sp. YIK11 TaxID=1453349 RepID=UPI0006DC70A8|nr:ATP-binding protein [Nonlabens sp. YIK11]KQC32890.1 sensor protein [Nonlabens sp. YIK11]
MAQDTDSRLSQEGQQIAVDAMLERANLELQSNRFAEAQKTLQAAMEIASDSAIHLRTQVVEANFFIYTGQLDEAQKNVDRLKSQIPLTSDFYIDLLLIQADIHIRKKEYLLADEILKTINIALTKSQDSTNALKARYLSANLNLSTANYTEALEIYKDIIPKLREQSLFYFESKATFNLAETNFEKGDYDSANEVVEQAISKASSYGFTGILLSCYYLKASIEKGLGNFEQAVIFLEKYQQLKESQSNDTNSLATSAASIDKVGELKKELLAKDQLIADQDTKLKGRGMQNILFFVLLTLMSLLTMSLFKNNKLRAKSNQTLEGKNSALMDERDRAQDAAKIKADFLSTITHELRTPMYAVTGLTHLLLETEPRHDQREHLETLQSSGEYLLSLIDNILDFNKLEANKVELEQIPFDLKKRVEDITTSLTNQAKDQGNSLSLEFDSRIPSRIKGDPVKMSQILINLVGNAIKFTKNGNVWIRVDQVKQVEDRCLIHFEVEDNGKGISEEKQQDIFNNFTQEGSSTTREYGGTGLGLAIVKNLVSLMGSQIVLDSKIGRGSIFSFDLWFELPDTNKFYEDKNLKIYETETEEDYPEYKKPVRSPKTPKEDKTASIEKTEKIEPVTAEENKAPQNQEDAAKKETQESSEGKNNDVIGLKKATPIELISKKILIVEDNKINQMITRKILEGKNFDCDIANNGIEALGKIKENTYDLVLMDIHMPGMDGKQCTREVRKFDRELPIIALTAVTLDESEKEFYEIGFDDIIPKPFKMDEFFEKIQKAFTNYQIY